MVDFSGVGRDGGFSPRSSDGSGPGQVYDFCVGGVNQTFGSASMQLIMACLTSIMDTLLGVWVRFPSGVPVLLPG